MSGVDNIRGIDYQVNYSILKVLEILAYDLENIKSIQFESLSEEEEDINIYKFNGTSEYIQIKKRSEGYNWSPSDLKDILAKFYTKAKDGVEFKFITNGPASKDVVELKKHLNLNTNIDDQILNKFVSSQLSLENLKEIIYKVEIYTNYYTSLNDELPGMIIKENIMELLKSNIFRLNDSAVNIYNNIYKYIIDMSQRCINVDIKEIIEFLISIGLKVNEYKSSKIPDISEFIGRNEDIREINKLMRESRKVIVKGISGIGKTSLLAKIASNYTVRKKDVFWVEIDSMYTINKFYNNFSNFLSDIGLDSESGFFLNLEIDDKINYIMNLLIKNEVNIFIDSLDKGNRDIHEFISNLLIRLLDTDIRGVIVVSSIADIEDVYTETDIRLKKLAVYNLQGFTQNETLEMLSDYVNCVGKQEIIDFHKSVGGYTYSVKLLRNLLSQNNIAKSELSEFKELSIKDSRKKIFNKVYSLLDEEEKNIILCSAIFSYPFSEDEVDVISELRVRSKYIYDRLIEKNIITVKDDKYYVHDSIRIFLYDINKPKYRERLHEAMVEYYENIMNKGLDSGEGALYEDIMKWGTHLEHITKLSKTQSILLDLENCKLDSIWAIYRFGYPFSYSDDNKTIEELEFLLNRDLIEDNNDKSKKYLVKEFDTFDIFFLEYLCLSRGISNHLGYIDVFKPNISFYEQGLICPWEHCIEHMPLPPMIKSEYEERINFLKEMFEKGVYENKPKEVKESFLREISEGIPEDAPDEPIVELEACKCPVFGHCCPGGIEQAMYCREMDEED